MKIIPIMWHDEISPSERMRPTEREEVAWWLAVVAFQGLLNLVIGLILLYTTLK